MSILISNTSIRRARFATIAFILGFISLSLVAITLGDTYQPDRAAVLNHLNVVISLYRETTSNLQAGERPSDTIFATNAQSLASQALSLAFDSARAEAALLPESQNSAPASSPTPANGGSADSTRNYSQIQQRVSQTINDDQDKADALNKQIASTPGSQRANLMSQRDALNGEISLNKAMLDAIQKMTTFAETNNANGQSFEGSINQLAASVPEVLGTSKNKNIQKPVPVQTTSHSSGLLGQMGSLYDEMEDLRAIDRLLQQEARVRDIADKLRQPVLTSLRSTIQQGQSMANQPPSANGGGSTKQQFAQLTQQFNALSGAVLPLSQEVMVLDESRSNLNDWRASISSESKRDIFSVVGRVVGISVALGAVLLLSEIWRRLTFRYISDPRRRRQFLVLRRVLTGFFLGIVVIMGVVSGFSSLATYAGFVTAGIAVGLQTLLLSVAAYFFVIGRYGIRVGDRISVAGVTGDVVDVGLLRIYLMELAGTGIDLQPTGRIAVFSNSVLFQPATPLYKQVPGTEYIWHEIAVALAPGGDQKMVQERFLGIVQSVYEKYRKEMERQQGIVGDRMEIALKAPAPHATLQLNDTGTTLVIRYPAELRRASEADAAIAEQVLAAISSDEKLQQSMTGTPKLQAAVKG
jgi:small-conductance mechanosensitive channel